MTQGEPGGDRTQDKDTTETHKGEGRLRHRGPELHTEDTTPKPTDMEGN